jgi:hypothetical protein
LVVQFFFLGAIMAISLYSFSCQKCQTYSIMLYFDAIGSGDDRTLLNGSQEPCHLRKRTSSLLLCISSNICRGRMSVLGWWQGYCEWLMLIQTQMPSNSSLLAGTPLSSHNINYLVFQTITSW